MTTPYGHPTLTILALYYVSLVYYSKQQAIRKDSNLSPSVSFKGSSRSRWAVESATEILPSKAGSGYSSTSKSPTASSYPVLTAGSFNTSASTANTAGVNTFQARTSDGGWSTRPSSARHSRSSSNHSSEVFIYEEPMQATVAAAAAADSDGNHSRNAVSTHESHTESRDDGWGNWKPQISPEQEGEAAYRQRSLKSGTQSVVSSGSHITSSPSLHSPRSDLGRKPAFQRDLPPHLSTTSTVQQSVRPSTASDTSLLSRCIGPLPSSVAQSEAGHTDVDSWNAWKPSAEPVSGEAAFRKRQELSKHPNLPHQDAFQPVGRAHISQERQFDDSHIDTSVIETVVELPVSPARLSGSSTNGDHKQEAQGAKVDNDPWAAWSAAPEKDLGGADAFRRRQAMSQGERGTLLSRIALPAPHPAASVTSQNTPHSKIPARPNVPQKPAAAPPTLTENQRRSARRRASRAREEAQAIQLARHRDSSAQAQAGQNGGQVGNGRGKSPAGQTQSHPPALGPAARNITTTSQTSNAPAARHVAPSQTVFETAVSTSLEQLSAKAESSKCSKSPVTQAEFALRAVRHALILEKVRNRSAQPPKSRVGLRVDAATQVPEESLIDLVSGPAHNVMDAEDPEQLALQAEVLSQLQGLSFEPASFSLATQSVEKPCFGVSHDLLGHPPRLLEDTPKQDGNATLPQETSSPSANLDLTPQPYHKSPSKEEAEQAIQHSPSACSAKTFHSAADAVPCLIHDADGQSDGGSPVTPLQPLRRLHFPSAHSESAYAKSSSSSSCNLTSHNEEDRAARLSSALANLGYSGAMFHRILALLASLPKKDKAMCLFNEAFLRKKVSEALEVIAVEDEDSEEEL